MRRCLAMIPALCLLALPAMGQAKKTVDFHTQVVPVLMKHCYECHGGEKAEGGFSMNTRKLFIDADAAVPGDSADSLMIELVESKSRKMQMPPKEKPRLSKGEIATLKTWINEGLDWEEGFTFAKNRYEPPLKPRRPTLPVAVGGRTNPVDRLVDAYLAKHKLKAQPAMADAAFYRRASLDLLGILPEPADVERFVNDKDANKHAKLVDRLLADNIAYARHWMTFWNDLLRNDYTGTGYITGGRRPISNWLYKSLLQNKPYDQFTRELLAPTKESDGFIRGIRWRGDVNSSQSTEIQFAQNVGQVFLGINLKCASCHDSFIDKWTLEDAYGLAAVFSQKPLEINRCDKPTGKIAKSEWLFKELGEINAQAPQPERLSQLASLMTHPENGRLTRTMVNRLWHQLMGRGIVYPVDAMQTEPWSDDLLDYLAVDFADKKYDIKAVIRLIATSHAYRARAVALEEEPEASGYQFTGPLIKRMTAEQLMDTIRQVTQTPTTGSAKRFNAAQVETQVGLKPRSTTRASMLPGKFLQRSLGRPNREQVVSTRPAQLTTLQALDLANGDELNAMIQAGAAQLMKLHGEKGADALVELIFDRALVRKPTAAERKVCLGMLGSELSAQGIEDLLWSVFMLPEFQHVR